MSATDIAIRVTPLHPLFGAEVAGVDLARPLPDAVFEDIRQAFNEHQVLVFRGQALDDESQIAFSRRFGPLEKTEPHAANNYTPSHVAVITNVDENGQIMQLTDKRVILRTRNEQWHSDSSYKPVSAMASLLSGREVPPIEGDTEFATMRGAYEALPEARRRQIDDLIGIHQVETSMKSVDADMFKREAKRPLAPVQHPLVRRNPVNGRKSLFVGAHAGGIVGMPEEEARALLAELMAHCTQPQFVHTHHWRQGDLVMWDNRCTLHRATTFDKAKYRRTLHRTTVAGLPEAEGAQTAG
ncbi:TauD/TfdA dioxygenase family protein [Neoroseomonas lacus]|uniref:Alpha-ketoglutarate-dependent 2,4-dichlorophenoxyacetate dioxygenase n=1 Tax=Neoroseomonas lacus TaxID=287609 RepID=A0A917KC33_9PROT|nr:TauD/TfdA family dioxygenase [Neoroseomonas lacus]GGJ05557.1 alpha-ketoglutarate-dependent 2,4-dichlorophenoxyacetate dioxygenase [Neoroseomonas lacus]